MLESLYIRNLALVSELQLDFSPGLNTITGETGAGKSLIIGAIQLLTGGRASSSSIRKGEKSCEIAGVFRLDAMVPELQNAICERLENLGLPACEESQLLLRRVIHETGSRAFINGSPVTAAILKNLGELLVDMHGPHDSQTLLQASRQLELLDLYAGNRDLLKNCRETWQELQKIRENIGQLQAEHLNPEEAALLEFQLKEIRQAEVSPDEEQSLVERHKIVSHVSRLIELSQACNAGLSEGDQSIASALSEVIRPAREIAEIDPEGGQELLDRLEALGEEISELGNDYYHYGFSLEADPEELSRLEDRLGLLQKLKRKYGPTLEDVLQTADRLQERLERIQSHDDILAEWRNQEAECSRKLEKIAAGLTAAREKAAGTLSEKIIVKLRNLGFNKAAFSILRSSRAPGLSGGDHIEFMFAPNVGEDLQPLRLIGSSGEIARVMLAIKTVLTKEDDVPVLVFDEIDANIGGRVAGEVARELRAVARDHQVFSITHLPRIAAAGQQHLQVEKWIENDRTYTRMKQLTGEERVQEIIRMLGADADSSIARKHAAELLQEEQQELTGEQGK